jgi:hypothetical protein
MADPTIQTNLSPEEWRIILALREIPESPLRQKVSGLFGELLRFIQQPRCQGMQGDGFPCSTPSTSCEECQEMLQALDDLAARVPVRD